MRQLNRSSIMVKKFDKVIPAPNWLLKRMEKLSQLPPPTIEIIKTQLEASADYRKRFK